MVISGGGGLLPASLTQGIPTTNDLVNQHPRASQQQSVASTEAQSDPARESTKSREVMPFEDLFFAWGRGSNPVGVSQEGMRTGPALSPSGQLVLAPLRSVSDFIFFSASLFLFFCCWSSLHSQLAFPGYPCTLIGRIRVPLQIVRGCFVRFGFFPRSRTDDCWLLLLLLNSFRCAAYKDIRHCENTRKG